MANFPYFYDKNICTTIPTIIINITINPHGPNLFTKINAPNRMAIQLQKNYITGYILNSIILKSLEARLTSLPILAV